MAYSLIYIINILHWKVKQIMSLVFCHLQIVISTDVRYCNLEPTYGIPLVMKMPEIPGIR